MGKLGSRRADGGKAQQENRSLISTSRETEVYAFYGVLCLRSYIRWFPDRQYSKGSGSDLSRM